VPGGRAAALALFAGCVQRSALYREVGHAVADDAARSAPLAGGLSPDAALDTGRLFRDDRRRPALAAARVGRAQRQANRDDLVQAIGNDIVVTYVFHQEGAQFETDGPGLGFVDIYKSTGQLVLRLEHGDWLNAP